MQSNLLRKATGVGLKHGPLKQSSSTSRDNAILVFNIYFTVRNVWSAFT